MRFNTLNVIGIVANSIYHYNRSLFGLLAPSFAALFFASEDPVSALITTYALLPLGLLSKPLGALVLGHLGDLIGRRNAVSLSLIGMALSTAIIGVLPTYASVGWRASFFLACAQLTHYFFAAGGPSGGAIFLLERTKPADRCFMSGLYAASGMIGILLSTIAFWVLNSYGLSWRYLLLLGGIGGLVGFIMPQATQEKKAHTGDHAIPWAIIWQHRLAILKIAAVSGFSYANYYLAMVFMVGFLPLISPVSKTELLLLQVFLLIGDLLLLPLSGYAAGVIGKERFMVWSILGMLICAVPLFLCLSGAGLLLIGFVRLIFVIFGVGFSAPYHAWALEVAPVAHRSLIKSLGAALGSRLVGAPIPAISLFLYHKTGYALAPLVPLFVTGVFALFSLRQNIIVLPHAQKAASPLI